MSCTQQLSVPNEVCLADFDLVQLPIQERVSSAAYLLLCLKRTLPLLAVIVLLA